MKTYPRPSLPVSHSVPGHGDVHVDRLDRDVKVAEEEHGRSGYESLQNKVGKAADMLSDVRDVLDQDDSAAARKIVSMLDKITYAAADVSEALQSLDVFGG